MNLTLKMLDACALKMKRSLTLCSKAGLTSLHNFKLLFRKSLGHLASNVVYGLLNLYYGWLNSTFSLFLSEDSKFTRKQLVTIKGGFR